MKISNNGIRIILIVIFILLGTRSFFSVIYWIRPTLFGNGSGGGDTTLIEGVWMWIGLILFSIYTLIAIIGLIRNKKFGIISGYTIPTGILSMFLIEFRTHSWSEIISFNFIDLFWLILFLGVPILIFIGLTKIQKGLTDFKFSEYIISGVLTAILFLSLFILD